MGYVGRSQSMANSSMYVNGTGHACSAMAGACRYPCRPAEEGSGNVGVGEDLVGGAVGDDAAFVEGHEPSGEAADEVDVVVDDEKRGAESGPEVLQNRNQRLGFLLGDAAGGLVEE